MFFRTLKEKEAVAGVTKIQELAEFNDELKSYSTRYKACCDAVDRLLYCLEAAGDSVALDKIRGLVHTDVELPLLGMLKRQERLVSVIERKFEELKAKHPGATSS